MKQILITLDGDNIAPRFDLCSEIWIGETDRDKKNIPEGEIIILPNSSPENLCQLIIDKNINLLICGGIEEEYYDYLKWKKIKIYDSVIGNYKIILQNLIIGKLENEKINKGFEK